MVLTLLEIIKKYEGIGYICPNWIDGDNSVFIVFICRCCGKQYTSNMTDKQWLNLANDDKFNLELI